MASFRVVSATSGEGSIALPSDVSPGNLLVCVQFFATLTPMQLGLPGFANYQSGVRRVSTSHTVVTWTITYVHYVHGTTPVVSHPSHLVTSTSYPLAWRVTYRVATGTEPANWFSEYPLFMVMLNIEVPSGQASVRNFESIVQSYGGTSSLGLTVKTDATGDLAVLAAVHKASGTVTFPAGFTSRGSVTSPDTAEVATIFPSSIGTHEYTVDFAAAAPSYLVGFVVTSVSPPNAPTLLAPVAGANFAATGGVTFRATYNSSNGAAQNAYALRLHTATSASPKYWNATTGALQTTIVWNAVATTPGGTWSVTVPATALTNGKSYQWSMASQESSTGAQGAFATTRLFSCAETPTVDVTGPTGIVSTATPSVTFVATTPDTYEVTSVRVVVYTEAQVSDPTFKPGTPPYVWDSGTVTP